MAKRYTRQEFLDRLRAEIARGKPLVMTGAGNGIAAKFIERGGVDILGRLQHRLLPDAGLRIAGRHAAHGGRQRDGLHMGRREVLPQVKEVPVVAGLNGVDPLRDMRLFLEDCRRIGFSGVHNFPTVAWFDGEFRQTLEGTGLGYEHEIDMLITARELDMLTIGYAFNEEDCERLMKEAMPDIFIFHAGITRGGSTGYGGGSDIAETARRSQAPLRDRQEGSSPTSSCWRTARRWWTRRTRSTCWTTRTATASSSARASSAWPSRSRCRSAQPPSRQSHSPGNGGREGRRAADRVLRELRQRFLQPSLLGVIVGGVRDLGRRGRASGTSIEHQPAADGGGELRGARRPSGDPVLEPESPNDPATVEEIRRLAPDALVAVGYLLLLKKALLSVPHVVAANFHASLLPAYRGKHPVFWALRAGERWSGITVHEMTSGLDAGDIIFQLRVRARRSDSVSTLYDRIIERSLSLVPRLVECISSGRVPRRAQGARGASRFGATQEEDFRLDWALPAALLERMVRATPGRCFAEAGGKRLYFLDARARRRLRTASAGTLVRTGSAGCLIATGAGALGVRAVRLEDGKTMPAVEALRGMVLEARPAAALKQEGTE